MTLVYQAYGLQDVIRQTMFSIVTLRQWISADATKDLQVVVYTDAPDSFKFFFGESVKIISITADQIKKWRGEIDFVHRVKLEILLDAGKRFAGPLFYSDGDTFFLKDPRSLFSKVNITTSIMHVAENELQRGRDPLSKKICRFVRKNKFTCAGGQIQIPANTTMWNAGVIGLAEENKKLLNLALELTDQMYAAYQKHVMEQLAVSYALQRAGIVIPADEAIYHYWNQKLEYQKAIDEFLLKAPTLAQALLQLPNFRWPPVYQKKPKGILKLFPWIHGSS